MTSAPSTPSGRIWLRQAQSDLACANLLPEQPDLRCHAVAKYQQALEKSIKALAVAVNDNPSADITIRFNHELEAYINVLRRLPRSQFTDIADRVQSILNVKDMAVLNELIAQAPRRPAPGASFARNTEYPFQNASGQWVAPSELNVYTDAELRRWGTLIEAKVNAIAPLVDILYRSRLRP